MEHEPRTPSRSAEGLHLPKGTLEAGLSRDKDSDSKSERRESPRPAARVPLGGEVVAPGIKAESTPKPEASEAVSTWQRLVRGEEPVKPSAETPQAVTTSAVPEAIQATKTELDDDDDESSEEKKERPAAKSAVEPVQEGQPAPAAERQTDETDQSAEETPEPESATLDAKDNQPRREAADAVPLEGAGEIPLQAPAEASEITPAQQEATEPEPAAERGADNVIEFPMDRVRQPAPEAAATAADAEAPTADVIDMQAYRQSRESAPESSELTTPPEMPPPIGTWMERTQASSDAKAGQGEMPPESETLANVIPFPVRNPDAYADYAGRRGGSGSGDGGDGGGYDTTSARALRFNPNLNPNLQGAPNPYEYTAGDVRRKTGAALVLGFIAGRWGKNRAVKKAVQAAERRFTKKYKAAPQSTVANQYASKPNQAPADPNHEPTLNRIINPNTAPNSNQAPATANTVPLSVAAAVAAERPRPAIDTAEVREKTKPQTDWLRPETLAPKTPPVERIAAKPLTELLAVPAAVVALKTIGEKAPAERVRAVPGARSEAAMGKAEVMEMAKTIKIDGVPLCDVYEAKQIDEEGVRSVVETYLRGGDVSKQLQHEVVEKQKQFERDPFNRRRSRGSLSDALSGVSSKVVDTTSQLAKSAGATASKAGKSLAGTAKQAQQKVTDGSETQQWAGIGAVVVIWAIILWLVFG